MVEKLQKKANNTKKPKIVTVDDDYGQVPPPRTYKPISAPRTNETIKKPVPKPHNGAKQMIEANEDLIVLPPPTHQLMGKRKHLRRPPQRPPPPLQQQQQKYEPRSDYLFNFDNDIFETENESPGKFKIINIRNSRNKKLKSFTNEFKVKIF